MSIQEEHILIRYNNRMGPAEGTIVAHQQVLESQARVWIAKFGQPIANTRVDTIRKQLDRGIPTYLVLLSGISRSNPRALPRGAAFKIGGIQRSFPRNDSQAIPRYYSSIALHASTWILAIGSITLTSPDLSELRVPGSAFATATETMAMSMAGHFRLRISPEVIGRFEAAVSLMKL